MRTEQLYQFSESVLLYAVMIDLQLCVPAHLSYEAALHKLTDGHMNTISLSLHRKLEIILSILPLLTNRQASKKESLISPMFPKFQFSLIADASWHPTTGEYLRLQDGALEGAEALLLQLLI